MRNEAIKPLVCVAVPSIGYHSIVFTLSLQGLSYPSNYSGVLRMLPYREVGQARNILVQEAINIGAKYILFLDEDMQIPGDAARKLIYHLETKPEWTFVSGLYALKSFPPEPMVYMDYGAGAYYGWKAGEIIGPVLFTGMGCSLIRLADLDAIDAETVEEKNPWTGLPMTVRKLFYTGEEVTTTPGGTSKVGWTEDTYFFDKMHTAGLKGFVDTSITCGHFDMKTGKVYYPPVDGEGIASKPDAWGHTPLTVNLGAGGEYNPYHVNVDLRIEPGVFCADIRSLPKDWEGKFDKAISHHVLEHFGFGDTQDVLKEWQRILKPGGEIEITVPDLGTFAEAIVNRGLDTYTMGGIYGDQGQGYWQQPAYGGYDDVRFLAHSYQHNHHKAGFTAQALMGILSAAGFVEIKAERKIETAELTVTAKKKVENG